MLVDEIRHVPSARICIYRANTGCHESVSPAIPSFIFLGAAHIIAIQRRDHIAPFLQLAAEGDAVSLNGPQNIKVVIKGHDGANGRLIRSCGELRSVAIVGDSERPDATVRPW